MTTRSALTIVWSFRSAEDTLCTEPYASGMIFYGYWPGHPAPELDEATFRQKWTSGRFECRSRQWPKHRSASMEVRISEWPDTSDWKYIVDGIFRWFESMGAVVSWCGDELSCPSVSILDPASAVGSVYAAYSSATGLVGATGLDDEFQELDDAELLTVWRQVSKLISEQPIDDTHG